VNSLERGNVAAAGSRHGIFLGRNLTAARVTSFMLSLLKPIKLL
jgi:hypothetical protein